MDGWMDGWTCLFLRVEFFQSLNGAPEYNNDSIKPSHSVLLPLSITLQHSICLGLRKGVFKSFLNPSSKAICNILILHNNETVFALFILVNAPWSQDLERSSQETQTDLWQTGSGKYIRSQCLSTFLNSFWRTDLRHGWPPALSTSTSPSLLPTCKHTQMLMLAGRNQTDLATRLFPGPALLCGVGFLAELG